MKLKKDKWVVYNFLTKKILSKHINYNKAEIAWGSLVKLNKVTKEHIDSNGFNVIHIM